MASGSILETFLILFKTNSDDVEKGTKKAKGAADQLEEALSKTDKRTQAVGKSLVAIGERAAVAIGALVSVGAIFASAQQAAEYANNLRQVAEVIGVNITELGVWSDAVKDSGGTAEGFQASIQGMVDDFQKLATTGRSQLLPYFRALGINVLDTKGKVKDVLTILPDLAEAFSKISKQESNAIGRRLGLDQGTITLLQQGRRELDATLKQERELGVITQKQADLAKAYNDQQGRTAHAYRTVALELSTAILPLLTSLSNIMEKFFSFLSAHQDLVTGFFIAVGAAIMAYAVPAFLTLAAATVEIWGPIALGIGIATALAAAFSLLYEDIMTFVKGGDSLTGRVWNWLKGLDAFKAAVSFLKKELEGLKIIFNSIAGLGDQLFKWLGQDKGVHLGASGLQYGQQQLALASSVPIAAQSSAGIFAGSGRAGRTNNVNIGEVNVHTQATDANGISRAVGQTLTTQMRQTLNNYDDGLQS